MSPTPQDKPNQHLILTRGLHEQPCRPPTHDIHWCELITNLIRNHWCSLNPSKATQRAENGLRIQGTPYYFYVMRTELAFGNAVFFFREAAQVTWSATIQGTTPFDSGGLWDNKIEISGITRISPDLKRDIFSRNQTSLRAWKHAFHKYIDSNYDTIGQYVAGSSPSTGTPPIIPGDPNCTRAWTWEARIPAKQLDRHITLLQGFLSREDRKAYFDWLWNDSGLDIHVSNHITQWVTQNMTFAPTGVTASKIAEDELVGLCHQ